MSDKIAVPTEFVLKILQATQMFRDLIPSGTYQCDPNPIIEKADNLLTEAQNLLKSNETNLSAEKLTS